MPSFLHPGLLLLLLLLPFILLGAILAYRNQGQTWSRMVAPRLRKHLVKTSSPTRRWIALGLGLLGCALIIVALARPFRGETTTTEQISTRNILIAIDTSRSMLVRDGSPDRIATAKAMAIEVLEAFPNDRVGVLAFSGAPILMAPLTIDHGAVHETISQIDTEVIPSGGSDLSAAVSLALKTFKKTGQQANALIIISDGEDHSTQADLAAAEIRDSKTVVCAIGIGTPEGGIIPDPNFRDGKFRDNQGETVYSKMRTDALDSLARAGRGSFTPASSGSAAAISSALDSLQRDEQAGRKLTVPNEIFQWFLVPAIILLALCVIVHSEFLAHRIQAVKKSQPPAIKATTAVLMLAFVLTTSARAETLVQQADAAYTAGEYETALKLFTQALPEASGEDRRAIQFSIGSTAYKLKQWEKSNNYLSSALLTNNAKLQEQVHYNLGNALFQTGWNILQPPSATKKPSLLDIMRNILSPKKKEEQAKLTAEDVDHVIQLWEDSITHYQAALDLNPENKDADHNRKEVEKLLKQLREAKKQAEQEKEQQDKSQEGEGDKPKDQQDEGEEPDDQKGEGEKPKDDPEGEKTDGEGGDKPDENNPKDGDEGEETKDQPQQGDQPDPKNMERKDGESEEAYAARILKENSDSETRPVSRPQLRLRRPAKDW
ncbi:hypothetical protein NT6N_34110 [Oceaniferula spumae]|uniref:VWFA domain-containing protein n=1 Tax=Oceaniferula spumae TaxID=2979115 RepID=A0AAT9FR61_9BACT